MLFDWRHQFHAKALFSLIQTWLGFTERERRREINSFVSYRIAGGQINSLVTLLLGVTRKIYRHSACALRAWLLVCLSRRVIKHLRKCTFHFWNLTFKEPFSDFGVFHVFAAKIQTELDFEIQRSFLRTFSRTNRPRYCKDSLCSSSVLRNIILGFSGATFVQVWACSRLTFLLPLKDLAQQSGFITKHERPDHFPTLESCMCVFYRLESRSSDFTRYCEDRSRRDWDGASESFKLHLQSFWTFRKYYLLKGRVFPGPSGGKTTSLSKVSWSPRKTAINSIIVSGLLIFRLVSLFQTNFLL